MPTVGSSCPPEVIYPQKLYSKQIHFSSFSLNSMILVVAKQSSKVYTTPLIHSRFYPVASSSHVRVSGSFLLYQSKAGCRSAQPGAMSAALVWFDRKEEKSRGRFWNLFEISSSPIKEPWMYSSSAGNELSKKSGQAQRGTTAFTVWFTDQILAGGTESWNLFHWCLCKEINREAKDSRVRLSCPWPSSIPLSHSNFRGCLKLQPWILKLSKAIGGTVTSDFKYKEISSFIQCMMNLCKPQMSGIYSGINWSILLKITGDSVQSLMIM